ncbi:MAG TPA: amino acid ABC transporter permease [Actinomycetota bacterium]
MDSRGGRLREWVAHRRRHVAHRAEGQNTLSLAVLIVGIASLALVLVGIPLVITARGWIPDATILESVQSGPATMLLFAAVAGGLVAAAVGFGVYRRMATKPSRKAAISGAALGVQAVVAAGLLLLVRSGENFAFLVRQNLRFEVLEGFLPDFITAIKNTILLAFFGELGGIVIGLILAMMALSRHAVVRAPARAYINFFRGTPLLWQLSFFYLGFVLGLGLAQTVTVFQAAVFIFSLNAAAYTAEVFRAGIQSIERGQMEAARSLGMTYFQAMRYAILPQAFRRVIPPLTNEFIILIKDTSLVTLLGLTADQRELLTWARDLYAETFNATPWLAAAAGYMIVTLPMIRAVSWLERKLRSGLVGVGA